MSASTAITANFAKMGTDTCVGNDRRSRRLTSNVMRISRDVFPVKTSHHLADITGYSVRSCERWLSERVTIPADGLAALLQSEWGRDFLAAVMTDNTPRWWLQLKAWMGSVDLAAAAIKHRRKLRELLDDANHMPGTAALLLQDEDFYSGQLGASRSFASKR
jgi:hypothetical protein